MRPFILPSITLISSWHVRASSLSLVIFSWSRAFSSPRLTSLLLISSISLLWRSSSPACISFSFAMDSRADSFLANSSLRERYVLLSPVMTCSFSSSSRFMLSILPCKTERVVVSIVSFSIRPSADFLFSPEAEIRSLYILALSTSSSLRISAPISLYLMAFPACLFRLLICV